MANKWPEFTINELKAPIKSAIAMGPFGSRIKADNFVKKGIPIIKGGNLHGANVKDSGFDFLTEAKAEELKNSQAFRGDLVITHRGTIGQVSIIPENSKYEKYIVSQSQLKVTLDTTKVNPYFVNYFFRSQLGQHRLLSNSSQVGVPAIAKASTSIKEILVPCPSLKKQSKIVSVLQSLDDKIELNRQINETLEKMAQALFKSWFVDFDPVIDNALESGNEIPNELQEHAQRRQEQIAKSGHQPLPDDIRQLFPSEFKFTDQMGWVPQGWEVCLMGEMVDIASSKRVFAKDYVENGVPFFRGKEITELSKGNKINTEIFISEEKYQELKEKAGAPKKGDILITSVGTIGNTYLVKESDKFYFKDGNLTWIRGYKNSFMPFYLKEWFMTNRAKDAIERIKIGTTQQAITIKALNSVTMLNADSKVIKLFEEHAENIFDKHDANIDQISSLSHLRDKLLPKLISGELTI
tara:strand:+ start:3253 stop:4653 length:1401 start_codon:yes stop_codon:yes gene_type:complete